MNKNNQNNSEKFLAEYSEYWNKTPEKLMDEYSYHIELTKELDNLKTDDFDREALYKIVLWKLSRFPYISDELFDKLKGVAEIEPKSHREAKCVLEALLDTRGIALPMASTILRFINSKTFQIIDDRVFRILFKEHKKYPTKPQKVTVSWLNTSSEIYFKYLDKLHEVSSEKLPFELSDRILYQLDKKIGNKIGD